jgi:hypothetical protein
MIYITNCPKCHETVSFLNGEDTKICKACGEVVYNIKSNNYKTYKEQEDADRSDESGD